MLSFISVVYVCLIATTGALTYTGDTVYLILTDVSAPVIFVNIYPYMCLVFVQKYDLKGFTEGFSLPVN